jgi:hypothetical protein
MNHLRHALSLLLGMLLLPGFTPVTAQVVARLSSDSAAVWVGRPFDITLQVAAPVGSAVRTLPTGPTASPGPELLAQQDWDTLPAAGGPLFLARRLQYIAWDTGLLQIPSLPLLAGTDTVLTNALTLRAAFPPADTVLADIKPILTEPARWEDFLPYLAGIAALSGVILAALYYRNRQARSHPSPPPAAPPPAHELALQRLKELCRKQWLQAGRIRDYHSELAHIIRSYIDQRFGIAALEQATEEILDDWNRTGQDPSLAANLRSLLETADLVKFAKAEPPADFHERAMMYVMDFILETMPVEVVPDTGTSPL